MRYFFTLLVLIQLIIQYAFSGTTYYVDDVTVNGIGTFSDPFNNVSSALTVALAGDTVAVLPGTFSPAGDITTVRDGTANQRITIKAYQPGNRPILTRAGTVIEISHRYITLDGFIIDGQFGSSPVVDIHNNAHFTVIRNCEVKNSLRDGVDIHNVNGVLVENLEIHHMLAGSYTNQQDAHGIVATGEKNLTIRNSNIYYVSGDCFHTDPNRSVPLWDNVLIENSQLWTGPLPGDAAGWHAGEVPGENAVDTKINPDSINTGYRPRITLRQVEAYGFVPGFISTRAAFNIKEQVDCRMEAVEVHDNEVAFRLRGPGSRGGAHATIINGIAYNNGRIFRTEDDIQLLHIYNGTFDKGSNGVYFQNVSGGYNPAGFDLRNSLFMGTKPSDAAHPSNMSADHSFFTDAPNHDYHLSAGSPAIDAGVDIPEVTEDFEGNPRTTGSYDVGAYEANPINGMEGTKGAIPQDFYLYPNYPNPFNPQTIISYQLQAGTTVELTIYNLLGQKIRTLVNAAQPAGTYQVKWDGRNSAGHQVAGGVYFCRLWSSPLRKSSRSGRSVRAVPWTAPDRAGSHGSGGLRRGDVQTGKMLLVR